MSDNTPRTTAAQLRIALALADAYGHEWAEAFRPLTPPSMEPLNLQNIVLEPLRYERLSSQGWEPLTVEELDGRPVAEAADAIRQRLDEAEGANREFRGLDSPWWDEEGDIWHATGTGRLSWSIDAAGRVTINAWRPVEVHAMIVILDERGDVDRLEVTEECRQRHLYAAARAMRVVRGVHAPDQDLHAWVDPHLATVRRTVARAEYGDVIEYVRELASAAESIVVDNNYLVDGPLDCQLPHTWGLEALRAWAEAVLP